LVKIELVEEETNELSAANEPVENNATDAADANGEHWRNNEMISRASEH